MKNSTIINNQKSNPVSTLQFCLILGATFLALDLFLYGLSSLLLGFILKSVLPFLNEDTLAIIVIASKLILHAILIYYILKSVLNIIFGFVKVEKKKKEEIKTKFYLTWGILGFLMSLISLSSPILAISTFLLFVLYLPIVKRKLEKQIIVTSK